MSNHDQEHLQVDAVVDDLRRASIFQVTGWTLLVFDALIIAVWLWTGFRAGSDFWLYWFLIEGVLGLALLAVGSYLKARAGRHISRLDEDNIDRKAA